MVNIVIAVYKDYKKTKECLNSVLNNINLTVNNVVVINDNSPEKEISEYLQYLNKHEEKIMLVENEKNLGFIESINIGIKNSKNFDVIILNSDTIVSAGWIDKILNVAKSRKNIACISPVSNSASNFSYPSKARQIIESLSLEEINGILESAKLVPKEVISAHGFCMYISKEAIEKVGQFDSETFGQGYGEENDFCIRAINRGFVNLVCPNCYIYHYDGASFGDEKCDRQRKSIKELRNKNPKMTMLFEREVAENYFLDIFTKTDIYRYIKNKKPGIIILSNDLPAVIKRGYKLNDLLRTFIIMPVSSGLLLRCVNDSETFQLFFQNEKSFSDLTTLLNLFRIDYKLTMGDEYFKGSIRAYYERLNQKEVGLKDIENLYHIESAKKKSNKIHNIDKFLAYLPSHTMNIEEETNLKEWINHLENDIEKLNDEIRHLKEPSVKKAARRVKKIFRK